MHVNTWYRLGLRHGVGGFCSVLPGKIGRRKRLAYQSGLRMGCHIRHGRRPVVLLIP